MREEYWKEETEKIVSKIKGFELLSLSDRKVKLKCKCGEIRKDSPYNFLKDPRCNNCNYPKSKRSKSNNKFKQEIIDLTDRNYKVTGHYINNKKNKSYD